MWLICTDAHSKYPFVGMLDIGRTTTADAISVLRHIFITEGLPETIVTDNGTQFTSKESDQCCDRHGIEHITSAPFHPASNGEAERFVQSLKRGIEKNCAGGDTPFSALQTFLATYRCLPHPSLDWKSPAEILHGRQPRNLLSLLDPHSKIQKPAREFAGQYTVDSLVYARNYGSGAKWLPGKIIGKVGNMMYRVRTDRGVWRRHTNQLQARLETSDSQPKEPTDCEATAAEQSTDNHNQHSDNQNQRRYPSRIRNRPDYYDSSRY